MLERIWNGKFSGFTALIFNVFSIAIEKLRNKLSTILVTHNIAKAGANVVICRGFRYRYPSTISMGENVWVSANVSLSPGEDGKTFIAIDNGVSIDENVFIDYTGGVTIKEDAHIARNTYISTHTHGYDYRNKPVGIPLVIGERAFIGSFSKILHNVRYIGKDSVIGTGSVVTKDVPDGAIVAGSPAKILKYRDDL